LDWSNINCIVFCFSDICQLRYVSTFFLTFNYKLLILNAKLIFYTSLLSVGKYSSLILFYYFLYWNVKFNKDIFKYFFRLDFNSFVTAVAADGSCTDSFIATSPTGLTNPNLCGINTNLHSQCFLLFFTFVKPKKKKYKSNWTHKPKPVWNKHKSTQSVLT